MQNLSLKELHARLGEKIAENERNGWSERNDLPVLITCRRNKKRSLSWYFPVESISRAMISVNNRNFAVTLNVSEKAEVYNETTEKL